MTRQLVRSSFSGLDACNTNSDHKAAKNSPKLISVLAGFSSNVLAPFRTQRAGFVSVSKNGRTVRRTDGRMDVFHVF